MRCIYQHEKSKKQYYMRKQIKNRYVWYWYVMQTIICLTLGYRHSS